MLAPFGPSQPIKSLPFLTILAIFTPLPTNSQALSHLAGKKTLARFSYTGLVAVSHRAPFHHIHPPPCCLCFLSSPHSHSSCFQEGLHRLRLLFLATTRRRKRSRQSLAPCLPLWEQELFSESLTTAVASAQHVGQTHPVWRLLSWTVKAVTARPDAPPGPKVNKTDMMLPLVSPS